MMMFSNCRLYNQQETVYYRSSVELEDFIKPHLDKLKEGTEELGMESMISGDKVRKTHPIKKRVEKRK